MTSAYHIFERLNTGGTPLNPQEIRNCVFGGQLVDVLRSLNDDTHWREILGKRDPDKHQKDIELILRLFALSRRIDSYEKPMKEFLNKTMKAERLGSSHRVKEFSNAFVEAAKLICDQFGAKPFHLHGPLNLAVLDSVFCTIMDHRERLAEDLTGHFMRLRQDARYFEATTASTSDEKVVKLRFSLAEQYLLTEGV